MRVQYSLTYSCTHSHIDWRAAAAVFLPRLESCDGTRWMKNPRPYNLWNHFEFISVCIYVSTAASEGRTALFTTHRGGTRRLKLRSLGGSQRPPTDVGSYKQACGCKGVMKFITLPPSSRIPNIHQHSLSPTHVRSFAYKRLKSCKCCVRGHPKYIEPSGASDTSRRAHRRKNERLFRGKRDFPLHNRNSWVELLPGDCRPWKIRASEKWVQLIKLF